MLQFESHGVRGGTWRGRLSGGTAPERVILSHHGETLAEATLTPDAEGWQVEVDLPGTVVDLIVGATSQGFYDGLLAAGVQLMLFERGLLHSKIMTVDGRMAMIGSANLDRRSFELNYEVNMGVFDPDFIAALDQRQASYAARSRALTLEEVRGWSAARRLRNNLLAIASPLL